MRLFVAINPPDEERDRLFEATRPLREQGLPVRWVEPESVHLTLKFLGWVRPERVDRVVEVIGEAAAKTGAFDLPVTGFGAFPSLRRPRVIWAGVEATPSLRCVKHDLEWMLAPLGFEREVRAFQPHLTLGRARKDAQAGDFRDFEVVIAELGYTATFPVETIDLMQSNLSRSGARYERIASAPLGVRPGQRSGAGGATA
jgi:2'-5' RNA ligase